MDYIYDHDRLFIQAPPELRAKHRDGFKCSKGLLVCYDVVKVEGTNPFGAPTWDFKIRGHDGVVYRTHYPWSLVENTPVNRKLLREVADYWTKIGALHEAKNKVHDQITTIEAAK